MHRDKSEYEFSAEKNQQLIKERGISFEDVVAAFADGKLLDVVVHHNSSKYPAQEIYMLDINGYVYLVPFVRKDKQTVFLKTIFPSRKMTKKYLHERGVL
jgi:uncharacterized DUF497 family protein